MRRLLRPRFSLAALLGIVALAAAFLSLHPGYARERYLLKPLCLPSQDTEKFFNTRFDDPESIDTSAGFILTKWRGPRFLETPMRLVGCPWFDRAAHITIYNDGNIALEDLRQLRELHHFGRLEIFNPQKLRRDYRELDKHLGVAVHFDCVDM